MGVGLLLLALALGCAGMADGAPEGGHERGEDRSDEGRTPERPQRRGRSGGGASGVAPSGFERVELGPDSTGEDRTAFVHVPAGHDPSQGKLPVIIVFHGGRQNDGTTVIPSWRKHMDGDFILAFPNGQMNDPRRGGFHTDVGSDRQHVDTVLRLTQILQDTYGADPKRLYATGFSSGARGSLQLACLAPESFAGFAPLHHYLTVSLRDACDPKAVRPMLFMAGTKDESAPFDGKEDGHGNPHELPAEESVRWWLERGGCGTSPASEETLPDKGDAVTVHKRTYVGCANGKPMQFYVIEGGAHIWPGKESKMPGACSDIDAADEIVSFFRQHAGL